MPRIRNFRISWTTIYVPILSLTLNISYLFGYYLIYFKDKNFVVTRSAYDLMPFMLILMLVSLTPFLADILVYFKFDRKSVKSDSGKKS